MQVSRRSTGLLLALPFAARAADAPEPLSITPELVAAAEREGGLTLQYTSPLVTMEGLVRAFNRQFPRVQVRLERKSGSTGGAMLLHELAAGVHRLDVFQGSDIALNQQLIDRGAFAALAPSEEAAFAPQCRMMAPHLFYPNFLRTVIAYSPRLVTDEQAKLLRRWDGVLDPVFKGKVAISEPSVGVTTVPYLYVLTNPTLGQNFLRRLKDQDPLIYTTTAQVRDAIISGQRAVSWGTDWDAATLIDVANGAPVRFVYPDPTPEYVVAGWGVLKRAPNPAAARLMMAWQLTREAAEANHEPYSNTRSGRTDMQDTRRSMEIVRAQSWYEEPVRNWTPDYRDWVANGARYQQTWQRVMRPRR